LVKKISFSFWRNNAGIDYTLKEESSVLHY
jgi:hypothetical protein